MAQAQQMTQAQYDSRALAGILSQGIERLQPIFSTAYNPANQQQIIIQPQNVGLVRGILLKVQGTIANTNVGAGNTALTRTQYGASNMLRSIVFTDTNNQTRHQTQGWHVGLINSAKQPMVFGAAYSPNVPVNYGNNFTVQSATASISHTGTTDAAIQFYYYIPLSYGKYDLRGAMWAGITNAVAQLQVEINPTPVVNTGDATLAVYSGNTGGWKSATTVTITAWQDYIDQIPMVNTPAGKQPVLPKENMETLYCLNTTNQTGMVQGQDFGMPYANWRRFLSTVLIYNNAGVLAAGTDITDFKLQTANTSQVWKYGPNEAALLARTTFLADPPLGTYYFDTRAKPIDTQQFGNVQLFMNPSLVTNSTATALLGYEYFTQANEVTSAQSLPAGN